MHQSNVFGKRKENRPVCAVCTKYTLIASTFGVFASIGNGNDNNIILIIDIITSARAQANDSDLEILLLCISVCV